jgi:hypothetical protein
MITTEKVGKKTITCMRTGLSSDLKDCGVRSDWYTYAFVGSIKSIVPIDKDEKELQIVPDEVFNGKPPTPLTVVTSQSLCWSNLKIRDHWLFYLRKEENKPIVLDYYGNDSLPVGAAREQIETLRRLKNIGDFAILRGRVMLGESVHGKVSVESIESPRPDDSEIEVSRGACWDLTLSRRPHAQISGHVRLPDGSPMANVGVILIHASDSSFNTSETDARGYFSFGSLDPGEFVVGINLPGAPAWEYAGCGGACASEVPPASLYYDGTAERSRASVIKLATDEKRDGIDFIIPRQ